MYSKELFVCECESVEHQLIFLYDENDTYSEIYCEIHLTTYMNFWQRLKHGVKYIFGFKSRYGAFDSIILNPDDHEKFQSVATKLTELHKNIENKKLLLKK
jgi:hypothetical protein